MPIILTLDAASELPPYRQIAEQIRSAVLSGALAPGEKLPSVRETAETLSINALTVARAMNALETEGLIESRWGKGNFVRPMTRSHREDARGRAMRKAVREFLTASQRLGFTPDEAARAMRAAGRLPG